MGERKFSIALWAIGGVGSVLWATQKNQKGRVWWFIGGAMVGASIGYLIDSAVNKREAVNAKVAQTLAM